jgi:4-carboxymuconolactone decarboxylase
MNALTVVVLWMMMAFAFLGGFGSRSALAQQSSGAGQSAEKLPPDIYPDSLSRMPRPKREDFTTDEEKAAFDRVFALSAEHYEQMGITHSPGTNVSKGWLGPAGTRMAIPEVGELGKELGMMIHEKNGLEPKYRELTILVATRESNDEAEFLEHEARSTELLSPKVVDIVRNNQDTKGLEEKEALIIQFGRELFREPKVSSKTFAAAERNFGRKGTLGITLLLCYYTSNGLLLRAYDQHVEPGKKRF